MKITYKQKTFDQADIRLIKCMLADESLSPPRLTHVAKETNHPNWLSFFQKFRDVGGFDDFSELRSDQAGLIDIHNWSVNEPVAERILELWANPPEEQPVDHVEQTTRWFRSKKWYVPIHFLFVIIPAIIGYLTLLRMLIEWFTTTH